MFYGLKLDPAGADGPLRRWVPTGDPEDMTLPPDMYVACDSVEAGQAILAARHPCPAALPGWEATRVVGGRIGGRYRAGVLVATCPMVVEVDRYHPPTVDLLTAATAAHGQVLLGGYRLSVGTIRAQPGYGESNLAAADVPGFPGIVAVRYDERAARTRRTRAAGAARRADERRQAEAAEAAAAEARVAERKRLDAAYAALARAVLAVWAGLPHVTRVAPPDRLAEYFRVTYAAEYHYSRYAPDPVPAFFAAAALRSRLTGRRVPWRVPAVRAALAALRPVLPLFGTPADRFADRRKKSVKMRRALDRLVRAVRRYAPRPRPVPAGG